jgi:hypothetical protein
MFEPTLPSPEDWLRDPVFSWGRLWQAFNYKLDAYQAGVKQIPLLEGKLVGYDLAIQRMPPDAARANLEAMLQKYRRALDALKANRSSLEGKVMQTLTQLRSEGTRLKQLPPAGIGLIPIVGAALIGAAALVMYGITQWLTALAGAVAQEKSVGGQIAAYARERGLSAEQTQALLREASKVPAPKAPGDLFGSIAEILPWALGLAAAVYFGPTVLTMLKAGTSRRRAA